MAFLDDLKDKLLGTPTPNYNFLGDGSDATPWGSQDSSSTPDFSQGFDASNLNVSPGFTPQLPQAAPGQTFKGSSPQFLDPKLTQPPPPDLNVAPQGGFGADQADFGPQAAADATPRQGGLLSKLGNYLMSPQFGLALGGTLSANAGNKQAFEQVQSIANQWRADAQTKLAQQNQAAKDAALAQSFQKDQYGNTTVDQNAYLKALQGNGYKGDYGAALNEAKGLGDTLDVQTTDNGIYLVNKRNGTSRLLQQAYKPITLSKDQRILLPPGWGQNAPTAGAGGDQGGAATPTAGAGPTGAGGAPAGAGGPPDNPQGLLASQVWANMKKRESGGLASPGTAVSPKGAQGSTQMLPATAQAMAQKAGLDWRPDLMQSNTPEALQYQDELGKQYFAEGLRKYNGNLYQAASYYHGGPNEAQWGPKTRAYAQAVTGVGPAAAGGQGAAQLQGGSGSDQIAGGGGQVAGLPAGWTMIGGGGGGADSGFPRAATPKEKAAYGVAPDAPLVFDAKGQAKMLPGAGYKPPVPVDPNRTLIQTQQIDETIGNVQKALDQMGTMRIGPKGFGGFDFTPTTGRIGFLERMTGDPQNAQLAGTLRGIRAALSVQVMQAQRALAQHGGGMGNVAYKEFGALGDSIANLDQAQDAPALRQALIATAQHLGRARWRIQQMAKSGQGVPGITAPEETPQAAPAGGGAEEDLPPDVGGLD